MPTRPRRIAGQTTSLRTTSQPEHRAQYARFGANDPMVNAPDGYPSAYAPIGWLDASGGSGPTDWWYGVDSGGLRVPIGPHGPWSGQASDQAVITRATSLIVGPLSASPYRVVTDGAVGQPLPTPSWVRDPMLLRPDARVIEAVYPSVLRLSRSAFWSGFVRNSLHYGLGAFIYTPDEAGAPLAGSLRLVDPRFLTTERDTGGALCWSIDDGEGSPAVFERDGSIRFGAVEYRLCVLRNPLSSIDTEGMSLGVFASSPTTFRIGSQIQQYTSGTFASGIPSGYLKVEQPILTQEQSDELKSKWLANHGGAARSIAVLNAVTSFTPLTYSPESAQLGESARLSVASVAFAFGLAPETLSVTLTNSGTYNTIRDAWLNHRDYGLSPWLVALQDVLSALLPGSQGIVVNLDSFANPSLKERVETGAAAVAAGLLLPEEWRAMEGLPPLPADAPEPAPAPVIELPPPVEEPPAARHLSWRA